MACAAPCETESEMPLPLPHCPPSSNIILSTEKNIYFQIYRVAIFILFSKVLSLFSKYNFYINIGFFVISTWNRFNPPKCKKYFLPIFSWKYHIMPTWPTAGENILLCPQLGNKAQMEWLGALMDQTCVVIVGYILGLHGASHLLK